MIWDVIMAIPYYRDKNKMRDNEITQCIINNLANIEVSSLILVSDKDVECPVDDPRLIIVNNGRWPTYQDMFAIVNRVDSMSDPLDGTLRIVCNADIFIDNDAINLMALMHKDQCLALSRWDITNGGVFHHNTLDSQDTWVFRGKVRDGKYDFKIGKPGCDNRIAAELVRAGYDVINPSKTIKTFHLHKTGVRNYTRNEGEVVSPPYEFITPTFMGEKGYKNHDSAATNTTPPTIKVKEDGSIDYDFHAQKMMMAQMAQSGEYKQHKLLTIAIPTLKSRRDMFDVLHEELRRQIADAGLINEVEIYPYRDGGHGPIGWKRNHIAIHCNGKYIVHFDDDDWPADNYVKSLVSALKENKDIDCVTFNAVVTYDGENEELMIYDACYKENRQLVGDDGKTFRTRMPSHINVIRRDIALMHPFKVLKVNGGSNMTREERGDNGSDVTNSQEMVTNNAIRSHVHIGDVLYYYRYKSKK